MINVDRGNWTSNKVTFNHVAAGLDSSKIYLNKLFNLLSDKNIDGHLIIYPWPRQIYIADKFHQTYWKKFSSNNNIKYLSLYNLFEGSNKIKIIFDNFIPGDVHWNKKGHNLIFNAIIKSNIIKN